MLQLTAGACKPGGEEGVQGGLGVGKIRSLDGVSCGEKASPFQRGQENQNPHGEQSWALASGRAKEGCSPQWSEAVHPC